MGAATEVSCAGQINRSKGARVIRSSMVTEHCDCFYSTPVVYIFSSLHPLKILPGISVAVDRFGVVVVAIVVVLVVNGSLDLAAQAIVLQAFLFHLAIQDAATEFRCAGQMHRTRDARAVGCHSFVRRVAKSIVSREIAEPAGALLALKLSRCM